MKNELLRYLKIHLTIILIIFFKFRIIPILKVIYLIIKIVFYKWQNRLII